MVPGLIIAFFGIVNWFFLVPNPQFVGIDNETVSYFCLKYDNFCTKRSLSSQYIYLLICFVRSLNWIRLNVLQTTLKFSFNSEKACQKTH